MNKKELQLKPNSRYLLKINKFKIFSLDRSAALKAGELWAQLKQSGHMIKIMDILIGAIVLTQDHKKIITNDKHFSHIPGLIALHYSID